MVAYEQHDDNDVIIPDKISRKLVVSSHLLLANGILACVFRFYGLCATLLFVYGTSIVHWYRPRFSSIARRVDYFAVVCNFLYGAYLVAYRGRYDEFLLGVFFGGVGCILIVFVCNEASYYLQVMKTPLGSNTRAFKSNSVTTQGEDASASHHHDDSRKIALGQSQQTQGTLPEETIDLVTLRDIAVSECTSPSDHHSKAVSTEENYWCYSRLPKPTVPHTPDREWVYQRTVLVHLIGVHIGSNSLVLFALLRLHS
jgi:hypothetical protein